MSKLTHFDDEGRAHMVDVGAKAESDRQAVATGVVEMEAATLARIHSGTLEKGDVLGIARVAAIQGAKRTSELIPLCHPVRVTGIDVELSPSDEGARPRIEIRVTARAHDRTGVEMEALTAVAVAGLTIYDMCKSIDRKMRIGAIQLESKQGGKSGTWTRTV
jgi:cyclic pyranopterin monophosphate synthase